MVTEIKDPTITIQETLKEIVKGLRGFQQNPTAGEVIHGHQDILGVPPNIHNLKQNVRNTL